VGPGLSEGANRQGGTREGGLKGRWLRRHEGMRVVLPQPSLASGRHEWGGEGSWWYDAAGSSGMAWWYSGAISLLDLHQHWPGVSRLASAHAFLSVVGCQVTLVGFEGVKEVLTGARQ
jgi:hypothetical protein